MQGKKIKYLKKYPIYTRHTSRCELSPSLRGVAEAMTRSSHLQRRRVYFYFALTSKKFFLTNSLSYVKIQLLSCSTNNIGG